MQKGKAIELKDARITIMLSEEIIVMQFEDEAANIEFLKIKITPARFVAAMGRLGHVRCKATLRDLEKVGKKHENKTMEFPMPEGTSAYGGERCTQAFKAAKAYAAEHYPGWIPDNHFNSQGSFFKKGEKWWARTTIRRWIEIDTPKQQ